SPTPPSSTEPSPGSSSRSSISYAASPSPPGPTPSTTSTSSPSTASARHFLPVGKNTAPSFDFGGSVNRLSDFGSGFGSGAAVAGPGRSFARGLYFGRGSSASTGSTAFGAIRMSPAIASALAASSVSTSRYAF